MLKPWTIYVRRDGKTERTVTVLYLGRNLEMWRDAHTVDEYDFTDIMPATRSLFADYHRTRHA